MKLKNFLKKPNTVIKENKTFHTTLKPVKKKTRATEKSHEKSKKRTTLLILLALVIFAAVLILFVAAFLYENFILGKINSNVIVSPGSQNVIEFDGARDLITEKNIKIKSFEYSSGSSQLLLTTEEGTVVLFSNSVDFSQQVELLDRILYSLKSEGKTARHIDLRYNRPIVKF